MTEWIPLDERLDACDYVTAVKVTARRRAWLTAARPGDRWAVTVHEGGEFSYGRSFGEAFSRAMRVGVPSAGETPT